MLHLRQAMWIALDANMDWFMMGGKRGSRRQSIEMKSDCCLRGKSLCSLFQKPVIIASCLHKEYAGQKKRCFSRRRKKTAVRNVSFCVKKGLEQSLLKFAIIFRNTH